MNGYHETWLEQDPENVWPNCCCVADFLSVAGITRPVVEMGPNVRSEQDQIHEDKESNKL